MSLAGGAVALALGQSCTEVCACSSAPSIAIVTGEVTRGDAPAPGAVVHAFSAAGTGCQSLGVPLDGAVAGPDGEFLIQLAASAGLEDVCVYVFARPAGIEADAQDSDTALVVLDFTADAVPDTALVSLILPSDGTGLLSD